MEEHQDLIEEEKDCLANFKIAENELNNAQLWLKKKEIEWLKAKIALLEFENQHGN